MYNIYLKDVAGYPQLITSSNSNGRSYLKLPLFNKTNKYNQGSNKEKKDTNLIISNE